jgi:hypothetical protein
MPARPVPGSARRCYPPPARNPMSRWSPPGSGAAAGGQPVVAGHVADRPGQVLRAGVELDEAPDPDAAGPPDAVPVRADQHLPGGGERGGGVLLGPAPLQPRARGARAWASRSTKKTASGEMRPSCSTTGPGRRRSHRPPAPGRRPAQWSIPTPPPPPPCFPTGRSSTPAAAGSSTAASTTATSPWPTPSCTPLAVGTPSHRMGWTGANCRRSCSQIRAHRAAIRRGHPARRDRHAAGDHAGAGDSHIARVQPAILDQVGDAVRREV